MKISVGTSGWYYDWNKDLSLDWYIEHSGLNAIELNASFYRFPFPNQVKSWAKKGTPLRWVIKVNRLITHRMKFSERAFTTWQKFLNLFARMNDMIDYFLFQLPPSTTPKARDTIADFLKKAKIIKRCALEPRHETWFNKEMLQWAKSLGITWVSIDAPEFSRDIFKTTKNVYLRVHGRTDWYHHNYSSHELHDMAQRIAAVKPERTYVFFNNNHNMLKNAQAMHAVLNTIGAR